MRSAAGAGDDHLVAGGLGALGEGKQPVRRAMRRDDAFVVGDAERRSVLAAWRMVSQSDWLPIMMATGAAITSILFGNPET